MSTRIYVFERKTRAAIQATSEEEARWLLEQDYWHVEDFELIDVKEAA